MCLKRTKNANDTYLRLQFHLEKQPGFDLSLSQQVWSRSAVPQHHLLVASQLYGVMTVAWLQRCQLSDISDLNKSNLKQIKE